MSETKKKVSGKKTAEKKPAKKSENKAPQKTPSKEVANISKGEEIGLAAGKIWKYLEKTGEASPSKLASDTGLNTKDVQRAIGWLAREGKLIIESDGRTEVFRLV